MNASSVPDIIVARIPIYLRTLTELGARGQRTTSSKELSELVNVSAAQIRKDLSQFGEFGKQGTGYNVPYLIEQLRKILKVDRVWDVAVVGMGDMGHALARYQGFVNRGFRIVMLFDSDLGKVGEQVGELTIRNINELIGTIQGAGIQVAMLTVPASAAQGVADQLIEAGVKAILSYAPIILNIPDDVYIRYIDPATNLQWMTYYLA
jgi:redox-sensing transcriptional repressor